MRWRHGAGTGGWPRVDARHGTVPVAPAKRRLADKESRALARDRDAARPDLAAAARSPSSMIGREFFANWSLTPAAKVHLLTRLMNDHALVKGGTVRGHSPTCRSLPPRPSSCAERRAPRTAHL